MVYVYGLGVFPLIGFTSLVVAYFMKNELQIFNLQDIDSLYIVNQAGLPYYSHSFHDTQDQEEATLITTALSALGMFLEDSFSTKSKINSINFKDKIILIEEKSDVIFVLVCSKKTKFFSSALDNIVDHFVKNYVHIINNDFIMDDHFKELNHFVRRKFGMLWVV